MGDSRSAGQDQKVKVSFSYAFTVAVVVKTIELVPELELVD